MNGRKTVNNFLIGTRNDEASRVFFNEFQGIYSFTHRKSFNPYVRSQWGGGFYDSTHFTTDIAPVSISWSLELTASNKASHSGTAQKLLKISLRPSGDHWLYERNFSTLECSAQITLKYKEQPDVVYPPDGYLLNSVHEQQLYALGDNIRTTVPGNGARKLDSFSIYDSNSPWQSVMLSDEFARTGLKCELTTTLKIPSELFKINLRKEVSEPCPAPVPDVKDFRFYNFENPSKNDFTFVCTDGQVMSNRMTLFQCSRHFHELFRTKEGRRQTEMNVDAPVAAVNAMLLYLFTNCFQINDVDFNPTTVNSLIALIHVHVAQSRQAGVLRAIEACCVKKVSQIADDLDALMPWLVMSNPNFELGRSPMYTLSNVCRAILLKHHWNDYLLDYFHNQKPLTPEQERFKMALTERAWFNGSPQTQFVNHLKDSVPAHQVNEEMDE